MNIDKNLWHTSRIDDSLIKDLSKKYGGSGKYYTDVFILYLKSLNLTPIEYFIKYCGIKPPICPCGICCKELEIIKIGSNFRFKKLACGRNEGMRKWAKEASITRVGENNPMFSKKPWNKGLTKENSDSLSSTSSKLKNRKISNETKLKQSESAKKRTIHGHTGKFHTEEEKVRMRERTLIRIKSGGFCKTKTLPHILFCNILKSLSIDYEEEKILDVWSFDIFLPKYNIFIEIDGDYWHSNPRFYPDGPETKGQKINRYRDTKKDKYCLDNKICLYRFWEHDIIKNEKEIVCKLEKLFR